MEYWQDHFTLMSIMGGDIAEKSSHLYNLRILMSVFA